MSASSSGLGRVAAVALGIILTATAGAAEAQAPPPPPSQEVAAIASCLCLQQSVSALSATVTAKKGELDEVRRQLSDLDAQLANQRPHVDVDNPDSVTRFKASLERRDDAYRRSNGQLAADLRATVARYNERVGEYNRICANHPFNSVLMNQIQATLVCPPGR